jgi:hypothetical protein
MMKQPSALQPGHTLNEFRAAALAATTLKGSGATAQDVRLILESAGSDPLLTAMLWTDPSPPESAVDVEELKKFVKDHVRAYASGLQCMIAALLILQLAVLGKLFL